MANLLQTIQKDTHMLIATLPQVFREEPIRQIISCPEVGGVRYNTGMTSPYEPEETLRIFKTLTDIHHKKLWIDLKGRQLRITHWALPEYGEIRVNHNLEVDGNAWVLFRNGDRHALKFAHGNTLYLDPPPRHAVGEGQSLNIIGEGVKIIGYLTETDRAYIQAARKLGITNMMLSFVECREDIEEVLAEGSDSNTASLFQLVLKIESPAGIKFVSQLTKKEAKRYQLMAARDDLFATTTEVGMPIVDCLKHIIKRDPHAIVASKLFSGIEHDGTLALSDITDIELMKRMGFQHFMLSDEICSRNFPAAIAAWRLISHLSS